MSSSNSNPEPTILVDELVMGPRPFEYATKHTLGATTVNVFDMAPYNKAAIKEMSDLIQDMVDKGDHAPRFVSINHPGGSVPEGVGVMDYLREQCRSLDAAMSGGRGPVLVSVDLNTIESMFDDIPLGSGGSGETIFKDGEPVGSGTITIDDIRRRIHE